MLTPRAAYVHVPFCRQRCGYCNFTLVAGRDDLMPQFLSALERELRCLLGQPQRMSTVFLGGGTPTHLPPQQLERLLQIIAHWLPLDSSTAEYSCEANPLDCDDSRLSLLVAGGVNRLSLGGQSFSARKLRLLERDHSPSDLQRAVECCRDYFENLSLDLIFAVPDETLAEWDEDLERAGRLPLKHLSTYGLTIERGAAFYGRSLRSEIVELDADLQLAMYERTIEQQTGRGWLHYEVSNFAHPGYNCRHNQTYWQGQPWWAFGPGAASFTWDAGQQCMIRAVNHPSTTGYIRRVLAGKSPVKDREALSVEQRVRERLVFGLRMLDGVKLEELDQLLGRSARELFEPALTEYLQRGLLQFSDDHRLQLTHRGLVISDSLWPAFLAE